MSASKTRSPITTHILDVSKGKAAAGIHVELEFLTAKTWKQIALSKTNMDGRIEDLLKPGSKAKLGTYRLRFQIGSYFKKQTFYPYTEIVFEVKSPNQHYHVPLLISPFGYSTYRGT